MFKNYPVPNSDSIDEMMASVSIHDYGGVEEEVQRRLSFSPESIIGFSVGGFFLLCLITMNLYMNGWRKGCCTRSGLCWSNIQNTNKKNQQKDAIQIPTQIHMDSFSDDDPEMIKHATEADITKAKNDQKGVTKLGAILSKGHAQAFETIKRMTDPCCGDVHT